MPSIIGRSFKESSGIPMKHNQRILSLFPQHLESKLTRHAAWASAHKEYIPYSHRFHIVCPSFIAHNLGFLFKNDIQKPTLPESQVFSFCGISTPCCFVVFLTFFVGVDILTMTCKKIRDQGFKFKGSPPSTLVVEKTNVEKENVGSRQSRAPGVLG